jgi:hypothetical protein
MNKNLILRKEHEEHIKIKGGFDVKNISCNIEQWKNNLDYFMFRKYQINNYSRCLSNEEWLESFEGQSVQDAIDEEISYWDEYLNEAKELYRLGIIHS